MTEANSTPVVDGALAGRDADLAANASNGAPVSANARGPFRTLVRLLFRPGRTFLALRDAKRRWWIVPALLTVVALAFFGFTYARANAEVLYQQQLQMLSGMQPDPRGGPVPEPVRNDPHPLTVGLSIAGQIAGAAASWLVWAGLLALASTFLGQSGASFGGFFSMVVWARLPLAVRSLVQAIYMAVSGTCIYNQGLSGLVLDKSPAATAGMVNSGFVSAVAPTVRMAQPNRSQQVLAALLGRIDIYMIWSLVLTVAGVWAFARLPRRKAWLVTLGIWAVATLVGLLPAIIGLGQGARIF